MDNQDISLDEIVVTPDDPISIDTGAPSPAPLSPDVAASRAYKMQYGLGAILDKDYPSIYSTIYSGKEHDLRREAASTLDNATILRRRQMLEDLASKGPVDPNVVQEQSNPPPTDPDTIMEKGYGHAYMSSLDIAQTYMGDTFLDEAKEDFPESTAKEMEAGADIRAKREYAKTLIQNNQNIIDGQSWGSWGVDFAKRFIPLYDQVLESGQDKNTGILEGGGLMGENLDRQGTSLLMLPFDQYKAEVNRINQNLMDHNPQVAQSFLNSALIGQSTSERLLSNVFTPLDVATIPGAGLLGKVALRKFGVLNATKTAVKQVAKAEGDTGAQMMSHAGDAETSAVKGTVDNEVGAIKGTNDPVKEVMEPLTQNFRVDDEKVLKDPGTWSRELQNRYRESSAETQARLQEVLTTSLKVDPIADVHRSEDAVRAIFKEIEGNYRGPSNTILDREGPFHDVATNTYWYHLLLGNEDGTLFKSREAAAQRMQMYGVNTEVAPHEIPTLKANIDSFKSDLKAGVSADADVNELNRFNSLPSQIKKMEQDLKDLESRGTRGYPIQEKNTEQQGLGYYVRLIEPEPIYGNAVWQNIATTNASKMADTWTNAVAGWIRTPKDTMSQIENQMRDIATHGPAILLKFAKESAEAIEKVPNWNDWKRTIEQSRKMIDPVSGKPGYFFESPGELEDFYQMAFKRLPSEGEAMAYFTFKRNTEIDRVFRELSVFRMKAHAGAKEFRFYHVADDGSKVYSPWFDAIPQKYLPGGEDTALLANERPGSEVKFSSSGPKALQTKIRKSVEKEVDEGQNNVLRIFNPDLFPLKNFGNKIGDDRVRYVISKYIEERPLDLGSQVNRTGGIHFDLDYQQYLKQPIVIWDTTLQKNVYIGDRTLMPFVNGKLAEDIGAHLTSVQDLIRANRLKEAKDYHKTYLPGAMDWKEHLSNYRPKKDPVTGEVVPARLDKNLPFYVVGNNKLIGDTGKGLFDLPKFKNEDGSSKIIDGTRQGSDARQFEVQYTGERDTGVVHTITDKGTKGNPLYSYEPARFIDPITTLNRGLQRVIHSQYMDDMKTYSTLHWLKEAQPLLKADEADIRHAPFYYFNKANENWRTGARGEELKKLNNLKANHLKIEQFNGTPSKVDTFLHSFAQKMADNIYEKAGPKAAIVPEAVLPYVKDPLTFLRTMTFHAKMGLGSVPQFFTNSATFFNIAMISPQNAAKSTIATMFHQWSRFNSDPAIIAKMDQFASKMGWKIGQFTEAQQLLKRTGFGITGTEHAMIDAPWTTRVIAAPGSAGSVMGKVLDWGAIPFREGSQNNRYAAFFTAYQEFRSGGGGKMNWKPNPTGKIGDKELSEILARADLLDHNQSRAASSALHTGVMAPFGQFLSYSLRLAEMMYGKRLTVAEKSRLFVGSALLWGVPVGAGVTGLNFSDWAKQKAKDAGYVVGDNIAVSSAMEGSLAAMVAYITGNGDSKAGNWYNISRWGSKGIDVGGNTIDGDSTMWSIFGGASASTLSNAWSQSDGLRHALMGVVTGDMANRPIKYADISDILKEVTTYNSIERALVAAHTGHWLSKSGNILQKDVSMLNNITMTLTGWSDQRVADLTITSKAVKAQEDLNKKVERNFRQEMQRHFQAVFDHNDTEADQYLARAKSWVETHGYPIEKRTELMASTVRSNEDLVTRMDRSYYTKNIPAGKEVQRTEAYRSLINVNKAKEQ